MSIQKQLGIPVPDKEGVFRLDVEEIAGEVRMSAAGHSFVVCRIKDKAIVVQVIDCDSGIVSEHNIQTLCWRR